MRKTAALSLLFITALLVTGCGLLGSNGPDNSGNTTSTGTAVNGGTEAPPLASEVQEVDSQNPAINKVGNVVSVYLGDATEPDNRVDVPLLAQAEERCPQGVAAMSSLVRDQQSEWTPITTYVVFVCE